MKKFLALFIVILIFSVNAIAQENITNGNNGTNVSKKLPGQIAIISVDTGGPTTGRLIYIEEYYIKDNSGDIKLDQRRVYFNDSINRSKIQLKILRPLKDGKPYDESLVKAIAILDGKTILNAWYKKNNTNNETDNAMNDSSKKSSGLGAITGILGMIAAVYIFRHRRTKK